MIQAFLKKLSQFFPKRNKRKRDDFSLSFSEYDQKKLYIERSDVSTKRIILIPLIVFVSIFFILFWAGPFVVKALQSLLARDNSPTQSIQEIYKTKKYCVVAVEYADILESPDLRAKRITQALYNEPLEILSDDFSGFYKIQFSDKTTGYIMSKNTTSNMRSVEPAYYSHKLLVTSPVRRLMTHSQNGTIVAEVCMGTVLYSDARGDGVYRVTLPNGSLAWISSEGVVRSNPNESFQISNAYKFYETSLQFNGITYVENALTKYGTSSQGIIRIALLANGINISRLSSQQIHAGISVPIVYDPLKNKPDYTKFRQGDLIFFGIPAQAASGNNPAKPPLIRASGIITGEGQILMSVKGKSSIRIINLADNPNLENSIIAVRRIFQE